MRAFLYDVAPDLIAVTLAIAISVMVGAAVYVLRRHRHATPRIAGEAAVLRLLLDCGSLFARELRAFGVDDADEAIESLAWGKYIVSMPAQGNGSLLWELTDAGRRRALREREEGTIRREHHEQER